ncbi:hypothetical protein EJB05_27396, partial [Eragrostis curvula]
MARHAAAAGLLVWAVLLMVVVLGAGSYSPTHERRLQNLFSALFPKGPLPLPVRIYCKQNTTLNAAIRDNTVVLTKANSSDPTQMWFQLYSSSSFVQPIGLRPFSLVNAATSQVVVIPPFSGEFPSCLAEPNNNQLQLTENFDLNKAREELWTRGAPRADGFYQVIVTKDPSMTLNGLLGNVRDGTVIGIYPSTTQAENTLWKLTSASPFPFSFP